MGAGAGANASANLTIYLGNSGSGDHADPVVADVCEYRGLQTINAKDQTATYPYAGTYTRTLETGYTDTTTRPNELWVGGIFNVCNQGGYDYNTQPSNNFDLLENIGIPIGGQTKSLAYLEKIVSTTGVAWSGCYGGSYVTYEGFVGCIATFRGTVNNDCHLYDSSKWTVDAGWGGGGHTPGPGQSNIANSTGSTEYAAYPSADEGNTEYEQGYDPFLYQWDYNFNPPKQVYDLWGSAWPVGVVPLTQANQKVSFRAKLDYNPSIAGDGYTNAYINLWIFFQKEQTEDWRFGEIQIMVHKGDGSQPNQTPYAETRPTGTVDPDVGHWYFVGCHPTNLSTSNYTECTVDLTSIINKFHDQWGIDLSTGAIVGITFGVEGKHASMKAIWDKVTYQY